MKFPELQLRLWHKCYRAFFIDDFFDHALRSDLDLTLNSKQPAPNAAFSSSLSSQYLFLLIKYLL